MTADRVEHLKIVKRASVIKINLGARIAKHVHISSSYALYS